MEGAKNERLQPSTKTLCKTYVRLHLYYYHLFVVMDGQNDLFI